MLRRIPTQIARHRATRFLLFGSVSVASAHYSPSSTVTFLERPNDNKSSERESSSSSSFFVSIFDKDKRDENSSEKEQTSTTQQKPPDASFFSSHQWEKLSREGSEKAQDFWNRIVNDSNSGSTTTTIEPDTSSTGYSYKLLGTGNKRTKADYSDLAENFLTLFGGTKQQQEKAISQIVTKARETASKSDVSDETSFTDLVEALAKYGELIEKVADKYISSIDFRKFEPTALFYYLEYEDERKNPSWKRRKHRFYDGIDNEQIMRLNDYLELSKISYANSVEEVKQGLEGRSRPCELVYAEVESRPGEPANYVAIPRDQPRFAGYLEVIIGVRGTKSLADAITDLICEDVDYRGGRAHSFIVNSGKFIVEKHTQMLEEILQNSGKSKLKLTLVGHSLGAGAASIAGMEFQDNPKFDVEVIGFGCPALVSKDLATKANFITTVINDSDMVPRMSGYSVANLLMDVMEFDWFPYAERDAQEAVDALHELQPMIFNRDMLSKLKEVVAPYIEEHAASLISEKTVERGTVELFPPGKCLHLYRDGVGFSGTMVPNTFFSEIDVTRRMIDDHVFHTGYQQTFLELMRQHRGDHHFRFREGDDVDA